MFKKSYGLNAIISSDWFVLVGFFFYFLKMMLMLLPSQINFIRLNLLSEVLFMD